MKRCPTNKTEDRSDSHINHLKLPTEKHIETPPNEYVQLQTSKRVIKGKEN